jgi:hypothetical protein
MPKANKGGDTRAKAAANGKKVGRPSKDKIVLPTLSKQLAIDLYNDSSTKQRWEELRNAVDAKGQKLYEIRFRVEREIQNHAAGMPVQPVDHNTKVELSGRAVFVLERIGTRGTKK